MSTAHHTDTSTTVGLLEDFSLEMTGRDIGSLSEARPGIPEGTRINVTFLANEAAGTRLAAARAVRDLGLTAVPHLAARRFSSRGSLAEFLAALQAGGSTESVFVVGGDPRRPEGPYEDALAVIESGALQRFGVRHVGISGYPEGHPDIADPILWRALEDKAAALRDYGLEGSVITQFAFDAGAVLCWVEAARDRGVDLPIRIGVPGPAGVRRLLGYASRFGVGTSAGIVRKYGISLTNLTGSAGPDRFIRSLGERYDVRRHGELKLHFFTFGGLTATSEWVQRFRARA